MAERQHIVHPLEPVYDADSRVLILGTMPSPRSREEGFYYAHPRNRFWPVLAAVFGEPVPETTAARRAFLRRHRLALWDVLASCEITGAADGSIRCPVPNDIAGLLARTRIRTVFTTGRQAAALYRRLIQPKTDREAIALPSPSPANCACSEQALIQAYAAVRAACDSDEGGEKL